MSTITEKKEYENYVTLKETMKVNTIMLGMDLARVANSNLCHHLSTIELFHTDFPSRYREEEGSRVL